MAFPDGVVLTNVVGRYLDSVGRPAKAYVTFVPDLSAVGEGITVAPVPVRKTLDADGAFSVNIPASVNTGLDPDFTYKFQISFSGSVYEQKIIQVPVSSDPVNIDTLIPVPSSTNPVRFQLPQAATPPANPQPGQMYYDTTDGYPYYYDDIDNTWTALVLDADDFITDTQLNAAVIQLEAEISENSNAIEAVEIAVDGKQPAGNYAPAVHTHTIGSVTGLQDVLNGLQPAGSYAPAVHTHTIGNVTGLQDALDLLAPKASPTFTGTVNGITKAMVGLSNVTNTSDASKPVSTVQQAALDAKLPKIDPIISDSSIVVRKSAAANAWRVRSTGGAVDYDVQGDVVVSSYPEGTVADPFAGVQNDIMRWRGDGVTLARITQFGGNVYGANQWVDAASGVAGFGAKNGLTNFRIAGYKATAGAPTTGTWEVNDQVLDSDQVIWRCSVAGTPGTWVNAAAAKIRAAIDNQLGLLTSGEEVIPRRDVSFALTMTSGTFFLSDFVARKTEAITKIRTGVGDGTTVGVGGTHAWIAVYSYDGTNYTLVAASADTPTLWSGTYQVYETPLTTTFNKVAGQRYAVGYLWIGSGQAPSLPASQAWYADTALEPRVCSVFFSQTSLPNPLPASFTGPDSRKYQAILLP
jgi:hypothetical protein